ncbi:hypothetical protein STRTUCAR8_05859, partial [Streptomyces turgidiscabies Car8]
MADLRAVNWAAGEWSSGRSRLAPAVSGRPAR